MIDCKLKIGESPLEDMFSKWGFIYISSDTRFNAPAKKRETSKYAEESGEHVDNRTVDDAFDFKVIFLVETPNRDLANANAKIAKFNKALYSTQPNSDIKTYKQVELEIPYKRVKIVGIPNPIDESKKFFRDKNKNVYDAVQVEWTIRVSNPKLCDFDLKTDD